VSPLSYWNSVARELPGDDVEFGYPGNGKDALRPENAAVAEFLRDGAPFAFHASLHAMGVAEGAWFLIGESWRERTGPLRLALAEHAIAAGLGLHDIDRNGDKGFVRIARGFCTTPTSAGMKRHFLGRNDPATAELFHLNSMEFVQSLGGDPLVMVSEMPLFLVGDSQAPVGAAQRMQSAPPPPGETEYERFRAELSRLRGSAAADESGLRNLAAQYQLRIAPLADHICMQGLMVLEALAFLEP
jgi:hypothetical protein